MAANTTVTAPINGVPLAPSAPYEFLARPPPQKKPPSLPLPTPPPLNSPQFRRRSKTSITTWAAHVQPGSPAPCSPPCCRASPSARRRSSISFGRRPSITQLFVPPGAFAHFADDGLSPHENAYAHKSATSPLKDLKSDLTVLGYSTLFFHLPRASFSATLSPRAPVSINPTDKIGGALPQIPIPPVPVSPTPTKSRRITRFRSLSMLKRMNPRSTSLPPSPGTEFAATKPKAHSKAAAIKRKKAKYAKHAPPPLANELAMAQFVDGGSMESHIKRVMEAQAKAAAGSGQSIGVADVYRDGKGGIWWDQEEECEYALLLGGDEDANEGDWVAFDAPKQTSSPRSDQNIHAPAHDRKSSVSTQDSDLDPRFEVRPAEQEDLVLFGSTLRPGMSVLALPARAGATHLREPEFLIDVAFRPRTPSSPASTGSDAAKVTKPRGAARRRPTPLNLAPLGAVRAQRRASLSAAAAAAFFDADKARRDFLESSFSPEPSMYLGTSSSSPSDQVHADAGRRNPHRKSLGHRMTVKALFKSAKRENH